MLTEIKIMASKDETLGNAIYRIKLNLKQQDSLEDDHMIIYHIANTIPKIQTLKFLKEWSVDLPALEFVKFFGSIWPELKPTIFQKMTHLKSLDISSNGIIILNGDVFAGLNSLSSFDISCNEINDLPLNMFKDLINLNLLNLSSNQIKIIPEGLFKSLVNLDRLDLAENKIDLLDLSAAIFQGLHKLRILCL